MECADCQVPLVSSLENQMADGSIDLAGSVAAYVTTDMAEAKVVKQLLEAGGIKVFLSEDKGGTFSLYSNQAINSIAVLVPNEQFARASEIVRAFQSEQLASGDEVDGAGIECQACHSVGAPNAKFCDQCGQALKAMR
jgi:hypothetical protein